MLFNTPPTPTPSDIENMQNSLSKLSLNLHSDPYIEEISGEGYSIDASGEFAGSDSQAEDDDYRVIFSAEFLAEDLAQCIEEHRIFFMALMKKDPHLLKWIDDAPKEVRKQLESFSLDLIEHIKSSVAVDFDDIVGINCFFYAINGWNNKTHGFSTRELREDLLLEFLKRNKKLTEFLKDNLPLVIFPHIAKWEAIFNLQVVENYRSFFTAIRKGDLIIRVGDRVQHPTKVMLENFSNEFMTYYRNNDDVFFHRFLSRELVDIIPIINKLEALLVSQLIEEHRNYFIASMKGDLIEWVDKHSMNEHLKKVSENLLNIINLGVDVRDKVHRFSPNSLNCFVDAINGLENASQGRNPYTIETREKLLLRYLERNFAVTQFLSNQLPRIIPVIIQWEQAFNEPSYISENLETSIDETNKSQSDLDCSLEKHSDDSESFSDSDSQSEDDYSELTCAIAEFIDECRDFFIASMSGDLDLKKWVEKHPSRDDIEKFSVSLRTQIRNDCVDVRDDEILFLLDPLDCFIDAINNLDNDDELLLKFLEVNKTLTRFLSNELIITPIIAEWEVLAATSKFIEEHCDFFIAIMNKDLINPAEKHPIGVNLKRFLVDVRIKIENSIDVRDDEIFLLDPSACFIDAINDLRNVDAGCNSYARETRRGLLLDFLNENKELTEFLFGYFQVIENIISKWEALVSSKFIEEHRNFFITSMNGNFYDWVKRKLLDDQGEYLRFFSEALREGIENSVDVRDNKIENGDPRACFIDAINGLEDKSEGRRAHRKPYQIKTREELLVKFLEVNVTVNAVLLRELLSIMPIIAKWEQDFKFSSNIAENLAASMSKILENNTASQVKPLENVTNVMSRRVSK